MKKNTNKTDQDSAAEHLKHAIKFGNELKNYIPTLSVWKKMPPSRLRMLTRRMEEEGVTSIPEFWALCHEYFIPFARSKIEYWEFPELLHLLRLPRGEGTDHFLLASEGFFRDDEAAFFQSLNSGTDSAQSEIDAAIQDEMERDE